MSDTQKQERKKLTVPDLAARKKAGEKVVMASIPDYPSAVWAERAGIDIAAVGDSLGMVSYGFPNTLPVTIDMMIQHAQAVRRGAPNCLIMVSMTYGSYATPEIGVVNALRLMKEGGADDRTRVQYAFRLCTGRSPAFDEVEKLLGFWKEEYEHFENDTATAVKVASSDPTNMPPDINLHKAAAWMMVSRALLNLDETITKE